MYEQQKQSFCAEVMFYKYVIIAAFASKFGEKLLIISLEKTSIVFHMQ